LAETLENSQVDFSVRLNYMGSLLYAVRAVLPRSVGGDATKLVEATTKLIILLTKFAQL